jgi:hypothetical protein
MRSSFRTALLSLALIAGSGVGAASAQAGELTTAQFQQLVSASQGASADKPAQVTLTIGTTPVVFNVSRDAVGNVIARPVPGPATAGLTISQISISSTVNDQGTVVPTQITVISNSQAIQSFNVQVNPDGTLASVTPVGTFAPVGKDTGKPGAGEGENPPAAGGGGFVLANQFDSGGNSNPPPGAGTTDASPAH